MSRQPKEGATEWTLKIIKVPVRLYWLFHKKALDEQMELGKWVIKTLTKAAQQKNESKK